MPASLPTTLTAPPGGPAARDRGHPSVVAGWRDRDVRASRRRSARSQGRRRAVKHGCPSVARAQRRGALPVALPRLRRADVASTTPPAPRPGSEVQFSGCRFRICLESASASVAPEHLRGSCQPVQYLPRRTRPAMYRQRREARACILRGSHRWPDLGTRCGYGAPRLCGRRRSSSETR